MNRRGFFGTFLGALGMATLGAKRAKAWATPRRNTAPPGLASAARARVEFLLTRLERDQKNGNPTSWVESGFDFKRDVTHYLIEERRYVNVAILPDGRQALILPGGVPLVPRKDYPNKLFTQHYGERPRW